MQLNDKVVIVTGGSRGIGRAICTNLAKAGANVVLTYREQAHLALAVVDEITNDGGSALALEMDVLDRGSVQAVFDASKGHYGSIDILVNNAAIAQEKPFDAITDLDWDQMLAVNLRGPFICSQECLPEMIRRGWGRIINITSIGGQWGGFNQVHYAASKAGLINLTRSLAKLYSQNGITSNAVAVGLVQTDMSAAELATDAGRAKVKSIPCGRVGTLQDISEAVAFLASDQSDYITGQTINLNGGMYFG
jgi:acetoacetyl-CoA reductase/3-oxoacyl-[acyl-carrier protein] reductase